MADIPNLGNLRAPKLAIRAIPGPEVVTIRFMTIGPHGNVEQEIGGPVSIMGAGKIVDEIMQAMHAADKMSKESVDNPSISMDGVGPGPSA